MSSHGPIQVDALLFGWEPERVGRVIRLFESVDSTNVLAWSYADQPDVDGTVFMAEHQTAGRGRFSRQWEAPCGASVLCSIVLEDPYEQINGGLLGLSMAVAACDAIRSQTGLHAEIRWPNDLVIEGRKVAGVLIEARSRPMGGRTIVAGIGMNCLQQKSHFPESLQSIATSLEIESSEPVDRTAVARSLLIECDRWFALATQDDQEIVRQAWLERAIGIGEAITVRQDGREYSGVMIDVEPTSALVIQLDRGGRMLFYAANTTVVR